jgi:hypothetical protein
VTISTNDQKVSKDFYDNFDDIFGKFEGGDKSGTFTQGADGKMVPRSAAKRTSTTAAILAPIDSFKSPIDGTIINTRSQLAAHHKEHGTTDSRDYADGYIGRRAEKRNREGQEYLKKTRREDIHRAIHEHS